MTGWSDRLEEAKLIVRVRNQADRKRVQVKIITRSLQDHYKITTRSLQDHHKITTKWLAALSSLSSAQEGLQDTFGEGFRKTPDWEQAMIVASRERVCALLDPRNIDAFPVLDVGRLDRPIEKGVDR